MLGDVVAMVESIASTVHSSPPLDEPSCFMAFSLLDPNNKMDDRLWRNLLFCSIRPIRNCRACRNFPIFREEVPFQILVVSILCTRIGDPWAMLVRGSGMA